MKSVYLLVDHSSQGTFSLLIHELSFSPEELVLNPEHFPSIALHDVVEIIPYAHGGGR